MRNRLSAAALAALLLAAGCAADAESEDLGSSEGELGATVTNVTVLDASVSEGKTVSVPYKPAVIYPGLDGAKTIVPYLAIALTTSAELARTPSLTVPSNGIARTAVSVAGNFPSSPDVLVTDANFHILAKSTRQPDAELDQVSVTLPTGPGRKFILVRDNLWTKPMNFDVTVGR